LDAARGLCPPPHRGIETVTFVIEGSVEHFDNAGHGGIIRADDAQWMTAGRGVLHEENARKEPSLIPCSSGSISPRLKR
jgi:redox-sensitive bicupin YhaK (pirin superfamily)